MKLSALFRRMLSMCPEAWSIQIRSLQLCCVLLLGAVLLLIAWSNDPIHSYRFFQTSQALNECAQVALLLGAILPPIVEEQRTQGR